MDTVRYYLLEEKLQNWKILGGKWEGSGVTALLCLHMASFTLTCFHRSVLWVTSFYFFLVPETLVLCVVNTALIQYKYNSSKTECPTD